MADDKAAKTKKSRKGKKWADSHVDTFHYIAYIPWHDGQVYEVDGFADAPVPVATVIQDGSMTWVDALHPKLVEKMARLGGIRSNMLALVAGQYERAHDDLEMLKRRKTAIERRAGENVKSMVCDTVFAAGAHLLTITQVDPIVRMTAGSAFLTPLNPHAEHQKTFSKSFGAKMNDEQRGVLDMQEPELPNAWERCVTDAQPIKKRLEDLMEREKRAEVCLFLTQG